MLRWIAAALLVGASTLGARAETPGGSPALTEAMQSFFVIIAADPATGNPVAQTRRDATGAASAPAVVAFIDAADASAEIGATAIGATSEGRILNGAELLKLSGGNLLWRTSLENASLVNAEQTQPPAFYITNAAGEPLTRTINGKTKVYFYLDAAAADAARLAMEKVVSGSGPPTKLSVVAADFQALIAGIRSGDVKDAYFVSAPSVIRWADQWDKGARLIKDYKGL